MLIAPMCRTDCLGRHATAVAADLFVLTLPAEMDPTLLRRWKLEALPRNVPTTTNYHDSTAHRVAARILYRHRTSSTEPLVGCRLRVPRLSLVRPAPGESLSAFLVYREPAHCQGLASRSDITRAGVVKAKWQKVTYIRPTTVATRLSQISLVVYPGSWATSLRNQVAIRKNRPNATLA